MVNGQLSIINGQWSMTKIKSLASNSQSFPFPIIPPSPWERVGERPFISLGEGRGEAFYLYFSNSPSARSSPNSLAFRKASFASAFRFSSPNAMPLMMYGSA